MARIVSTNAPNVIKELVLWDPVIVSNLAFLKNVTKYGRDVIYSKL